MLQDEAMSMSNEQAIQILKPMRNMMRDQHGCPISDAYFAVDKAIHALQTVSPDEVRGVGEWIQVIEEDGTCSKCSCCGEGYYIRFLPPFYYCPNCGAKMEVSEDD